MAEAFARAQLREGEDFFSAALVPAGFVRPQALTVLQEVGLEVDWEHPRYLLPEHLIGVDYLVTISCDVDDRRMKHLQGKRIRWEVEDILNKGLGLDHYRRVRDEIETLVDRHLDALRAGTLDELAETPPGEAPEAAEAAAGEEAAEEAPAEPSEPEAGEEGEPTEEKPEPAEEQPEEKAEAS